MKLKRKILVGTAITLTVAGGAGAAFAYFSSTGSGGGSATAGHSSALTIVLQDPVTGFVPDGPASPVHLRIFNSSPGSERLHSLTLAIQAPTGGSIDATHPCTAADFALNQLSAVVDLDVPGSGSVDVNGAFTLKMVNSSTNQDGCQGATVPMTFTSN